jgi:CRP/FNR family transcriptional regulator, cyclic AMP receptor protein
MAAGTEIRASLEPGSFAAMVAAEDWLALLTRGHRRAVERGTVLMYEGEQGDRVVVLLAGHVKVTTIGDHGQETLLSIRGPGDVLGELAFLDDQPRLSTVTTIEPTEILSIAAGEFGRYLDERPRVAVVILRMLAARFRDATRKRAQFRELDTVGRLAARLVELSERYGELTPAGGTIICLPLTQEELGAWVGASHAGVAKALQTLRELGWIDTQRKRIVVRDIDALRHRST